MAVVFRTTREVYRGAIGCHSALYISLTSSMPFRIEKSLFNLVMPSAVTCRSHVPVSDMVIMQNTIPNVWSFAVTCLKQTSTHLKSLLEEGDCLSNSQEITCGVIVRKE